MSNNNVKNLLLIGIRVPNEVRTQWNNLESLMHITYVLDRPKVIIKIPALNEFVYYKYEANKFVSLNQHQKSDFVRGVILEDMFAL